MIQWLFPKAGSVGSIPGLPTRILDASWCGQKEKFSRSVCMSPGLGGLVRRVRLLLAHQNAFWGIGSGQGAGWVTVLLFSGGWKSSCLWFHEDMALGFPVVGTESSRCLALNLIMFAPCSPWAAPRQRLCMAKTLSRPIPETPLMGTLGSETAPWLCPTFLELHGYLGNVHPHLLPSFLLSLLHSESDLHHGLRACSAFPEALHAPPYILLACFILSRCLLLAGPK